MGPGGEAGGREAGLVSDKLAGFVAGSRWEDIPQAIRREAKRGILNFAGCMLAGRREPDIRVLAETFPGDESIVDAAASTAHDYDDTHLRTVIHATPPVGGALFALARKENVSGRDFMHAYLLGVETTCRIGNAVMPGHYEKGWHITSTCGVFGAAATASRMMGLNPEQIRNALSFAATQASGLVEMLGSQGRVLNAGFAARNGVAAAMLAKKGFAGPARPLEGLRGFFSVFGGNRDFSALEPKDWALTGVMYKPYPCGVVLHALIDACMTLKKRSPEKIQVTLHPLAIERTNRPEPRDVIEARLSAQHAVAVTLVRGQAGLKEFSAEALADPAVAALRRRVSIVEDASLDKMEAVVSDGAQTVRLAESRPMDDARIETKFRELAGADADRWLAWVEALDSAERVRLPG
jgi:2-methylcitrate dehydratase PrpD